MNPRNGTDPSCTTRQGDRGALGAGGAVHLGPGGHSGDGPSQRAGRLLEMTACGAAGSQTAVPAVALGGQRDEHAEGWSEEDGSTMVELLVAMVLFGVLSAMVVAGVVAMNGGAARITASSDAQAGVWQAFTTLDRQVRYADAINLPGLAGGSAWVEYRTSTPVDPEPRCFQWRYTSATGALQTRSWPVGDAPSDTWSTVLRTTPTSSGVQPFTTVRTTPLLPKQLLQIDLAVSAGGGREAGPSALVTTFVARNSSPESQGNADVDADGVSDTPVCAATGYRS